MVREENQTPMQYVVGYERKSKRYKSYKKGGSKRTHDKKK